MLDKRGQMIKFLIFLIIGIVGLFFASQFFGLGGETLDDFFDLDFRLRRRFVDVDVDIEFSVDIDKECSIFRQNADDHLNYNITIENTGHGGYLSYNITNMHGDVLGVEEEIVFGGKDTVSVSGGDRFAEDFFALDADFLEETPYRPELELLLDLELSGKEWEDSLEKERIITLNICEKCDCYPDGIVLDPEDACPYDEKVITYDRENDYIEGICEEEENVYIEYFTFTSSTFMGDEIDVYEYYPGDSFYIGPVNINKEGYFSADADIEFQLRDPEGVEVICTDNIDGCDADKLWETEVGVEYNLNAAELINPTIEDGNITSWNVEREEDLYLSFDAEKGGSNEVVRLVVFHEWGELKDFEIPEDAEPGKYEYNIVVYDDEGEVWDSVEGEITIMDPDVVNFDYDGEMLLTPVEQCEAGDYNDFCLGDSFTIGPFDLENIGHSDAEIEDIRFTLFEGNYPPAVGDRKICIEGINDYICQSIWYNDSEVMDEIIIDSIICDDDIRISDFSLSLPEGETLNNCYFVYGNDNVEVRIPDGEYTEYAAVVGDYTYEVVIYENIDDDEIWYEERKKINLYE